MIIAVEQAKSVQVVTVRSPRGQLTLDHAQNSSQMCWSKDYWGEIGANVQSPLCRLPIPTAIEKCRGTARYSAAVIFTF